AAGSRPSILHRAADPPHPACGGDEPGGCPALRRTDGGEYPGRVRRHARPGRRRQQRGPRKGLALRKDTHMDSRPHRVWAEGKGALNGWLSIPSTVTAEILAMQDFDSLTVDLQHGLVDYQTALTLFQAVHGWGRTPMARVPWNEPGIIMKLLDAGAMGIICP